MAKKPRRSAPTSQFPGVTFTSEVIRHVNEQTMEAVATTATAEAIPTPGYSEVGYSGCFIVGAQLSPKPGVDALLTAALQQYTCQIQVGDRSAAPALLNPNDVGFFAQLIIGSQITTSGVVRAMFPEPIAVSMPVPIIVLPDITIVHDCTQDEATHAGETVYVEIFYRTCKLADRAYTGLLLQQQRTS